MTDGVSTLVFADLAGYTAVTEAHGDEEAADLAAAFYGRDVREPVDLLSVECDKPMAELVRDPVCHMLLEPSRATEHLGREGVDHSFCSSECRRAFEADPSAFA